MQATRDAAGRLVGQGVIEVTQKGAVVQLADARGPIRLRLTAAGWASVQSSSDAAEDREQPRKQAKRRK